MDVQQTLGAGVAVEFSEESDFFYLLDAAQADVSIIFYKAGAEVARVENVGEGYGERFRAQTFDRVRIQSAAGGAVHFVTRLGNDIAYDKPPTGSVDVVNFPANNGAVYQTRGSIGNGASVQIRPANLARRYLLIQNNDTSAVMRVRFANAAAADIGLRLGPGDSLEFQGWVPTDAVHCIMETAPAVTYNINYVEG